MAQSVTIVGGGIGSTGKTKIAIVRLTNSAAETSYVLTAAAVGMAEFVAIPVDEVAAAAVRAAVTVAGSGGLATSITLTFTAGDELTLLCVGV